MQLCLRVLGERGQFEPGGRDHVGHVGAGATRDRIDADPSAGTTGQTPGGLGGGGLGAGQGSRHLEQLVESVDALNPVLAEDGGNDVVRSGQVARMCFRHGLALVGPAHLDRNDGNLARGGGIGRQLEGAPVLEPLDVAGDRTGRLQAREIVDEVGRFHVRFVPSRRPVRELDADLLALEDRASLMSALGDEGDGLAGEVVAEDLERVQIGVGSEHMDVAAGDDSFHLVLQALTLDADLGEPRREHDGKFGLGGNGVAQDRQRLSDQDRHQVELLVNVGQRFGAGPSRHGGAVRVDEVDGRAAFFGPDGHLLGERGVEPSVRVGGPHHCDPLRAEERVEVDGAKGDRSARDVHSVPRRRGPCCHVPPSCRAVLR